MSLTGNIPSEGDPHWVSHYSCTKLSLYLVPNKLEGFSKICLYTFTAMSLRISQIRSKFETDGTEHVMHKNHSRRAWISTIAL